jgi:hypothetical protein
MDYGTAQLIGDIIELCLSLYTQKKKQDRIYFLISHEDALDCRNEKYNDDKKFRSNFNFENILMPKNLKLESIVSKYSNDLDYVYIMPDNDHLVIMKRLHDVVINEITQFRVEKIINIRTMKSVQYFKKDTYEVLTIYTVGKNVTSEKYKYSTNSIYSSDIDFFDTIDAAYYNRFNM